MFSAPKALIVAGLLFLLVAVPAMMAIAVAALRIRKDDGDQ
jgi:hypothetical protein